MHAMKTRYLIWAKGVYLCLLTVYALLREVLAIQPIVGKSVITYVFFCSGVLLVIAMVLCDKSTFHRKHLWLPVVFLVICCISTIVNLRFDFLSNVKAIAWMMLYFMLLLTLQAESELEKRIFRWVFATALITMSFLVMVSLPMYFFNVDYTYVKPSGFVNNQGFSQQYMRLWGIFIDSNTSGTYSLVCICLATYLFTMTKKLVVRVLIGFDAFILFLFMVLTNSRTALVAFFAAIVWFAVYVLFGEKHYCNRLRMIVGVLSAMCIIVVSCGSYYAVKFVVPYCKVFAQRMSMHQLDASVHRAYDWLFENSGLNITEGYYSVNHTSPEATQTESTSVVTESTAESATSPDATQTVFNAFEVEKLDRTDKKADFSNGRFKKWKEVIEVFRHMPILGASPRGISSAAKQINSNSSVAKFNFAAHNSFLEVLGGTGILGFVVVSAIMVKLAWIILKNLFLRRTSKELLLHSTVLLVMVCEMMLISDVFFVLTFGGIGFWLSAGQVFALVYRLENTAEKE